METIIEPELVIRVNGEQLLEEMDILIIQGIIKEKIVNKHKIMLNTESFFSPKFCAAKFYLRL